MSPHSMRILRNLGALATAVVVLGACRRTEPGTFASPEEAAAALGTLVGSGDTKRAEEIFGPGSLDLFQTGDPAEDRLEAQRVKEMIAARVDFDELDADTRVLLLGEEAWPFPIPLVRTAERWRFDTAEGRSELLNRRVGYLELATLDSLHEYVDAQREYEAEPRDGSPRSFARRFFSSEGRHDGLYWPAAEGEPPSPLGDLLALAHDNPAVAPEPYRGYLYQILEGQGKNAPGGEYSYLDADGRMTRGFGAVAWPAKYGNSGVQTFIVNQRGIVYEKDLGAETDTLARAIKVYDPDDTWQPTGDSLGELEEAEAAEEAPAADEAAPAAEAAPGSS